MSGHTEATKELIECYIHGRGCEKDILKAANLGSSKAALEIGLKGDEEGNKTDYNELPLIRENQKQQRN